MLKRMYQSKEEIPEGLDQFYSEKDGKYVLNAEPDPQVSRLKEFRENNTKLTKKLESLEAEIQKYQGIDPERAREAQEKLTVLEEKAARESGDIDTLVKQRVTAVQEAAERRITELSTSLKTEREQREAAVVQLGTTMVSSSLSSSLTKLGLRPYPGALPDLETRARNDWEFDADDRKLKPRENGQGVINAEGEIVASFDEWLQLQAGEKAKHLFPAASGGGSGGSQQQAKDTTPRNVQQGMVSNDNLKDIAAGKARIAEK